MDPVILEQLRAITAEERAILDGNTDIDRSLYMQGQGNTVNAKKLLAAGKLITVRPHTRFIRFPQHTHDYVEMIYMVEGQTTHIVNGRHIRLAQGDLLFLNQSATHEILQAGAEDVAVNFIVLPEFFSEPLSMLGEEQSPLHKFLVECLCGQNSGAGYLHFAVSKVAPVQNLLENLLWILLRETSNRQKTSRMTMALLLMQLLDYTENLTAEDEADKVIWQVLRYIEADYTAASFTELSRLLHYDLCWLSRQIKRASGKTFTQLLQEKRLTQAAFLLKNTDRNVAEIASAVGYENHSYFHRIFAERYGRSPKQYRDQS